MKTGKSRGPGSGPGGAPSMNAACETRFKSAQSDRFSAISKLTFTLMVTAG